MKMKPLDDDTSGLGCAAALDKLENILSCESSQVDLFNIAKLLNYALNQAKDKKSSTDLQAEMRWCPALPGYEGPTLSADNIKLLARLDKNLTLSAKKIVRQHLKPLFNLSSVPPRSIKKNVSIKKESGKKDEEIKPITINHLRHLASVPCEHQEEFARRLVKGDLSIRKITQEIKEIHGGTTSHRDGFGANQRAIYEERLSALSGLPAKLTFNEKGSGNVKFHFHNVHILQGLEELLESRVKLQQKELEIDKLKEELRLLKSLKKSFKR